MSYSLSGQRNLVVAIFLVLSLCSFLVAEENAAPTSYDLKVRIEPTPGDITVQAKVEVPLKDPKAREFKFGLHETFTINQLLVNGKKASFSFQQVTERPPIIPAFRNVVVSLPTGVAPGKISMDIDYRGRLAKISEFGAASDQERAMDDQVNSHMIELAGYSSWYPQFVFGEPVQVQMEVSLPQGWIAICSGKKLDEQVKDGRVITRWFSAKDLDALIAASPNYKEKSVRESGVDIQIYHTQMPEKFIDGEVRQIADVVKLYTGWLGETNIPGSAVKHVYSPKRKGQGKAGISRPGMIVTSEGLTLESLAQDPHFSLFQPIAHEIAHFWWNFGVGQGDWINEAFAEYFSAIAVQGISSEAEFKRILEDYRKEVGGLPADAPPLATVPFVNDEVGFVVRYYKGALMLDDFRQVLGDWKFVQATREFFQAYTGRSITTADFRTFWTVRLENEKETVHQWLDSAGGIPDVKQRAIAHQVSFQIEPVGDGDYSQDSSFPIRCHFRNTSGRRVVISLPGHGSEGTVYGQLGLGIDIRGNNWRIIHFEGPEACLRGWEGECESVRDPMTLGPNEEFSRIVHVRYFLGGWHEFVTGLPPGKYTVTLTSPQKDSQLRSNEITILVKARPGG